MDVTPTDAWLVAEFMRLHEADGVWTLEVATVEWAGGAHSPELRWIHAKRFRRAPSDARLAAAQQRLLTNSRYFRMCAHCNERHNAGHMYNRKMCYGCAERELQVVF